MAAPLGASRSLTAARKAADRATLAMLRNTDEPLMEPTAVNDLGYGDHIVNVGTVVGSTRLGAFVLVTVDTDGWDLSTGRPITTRHTLPARHAADLVTVAVPTR